MTKFYALRPSGQMSEITTGWTEAAIADLEARKAKIEAAIATIRELDHRAFTPREREMVRRIAFACPTCGESIVYVGCYEPIMNAGDGAPHVCTVGKAKSR